MRHTISSLLLALVFVAWVQAGSNQRIAQAKCQDYHHRAKSNERDNCLRGEYPHIAFIGWKTENDTDIGGKMENDHDNYSFRGFGNLISEHYILTTAHITFYDQKKPDIVRLGAMDLDNWNDPDVTDYEVAEVINHPNYNKRLAHNDIGLVRLDEPVSFSESIRPACLWDSLQMNFTSLVTTAFGPSEYRLPSGQLQEFHLRIMNKSVCEEKYGQIRRLPDGIRDHQLCLLQTDESFCQGSSGSPAQITLARNDCVTYLVGIVSYGHSCGGQQIPDVYTGVASYIDWIEAIVWS